MLNRNDFINTVSAYKKDSRKRFDKAVAALIALAWPYKKKDFKFDASFELYNEAIDLCVELSDGCAEDARKRLVSLIDGVVWDDVYDQDVEARLDMAGSHLLDLLGIWIGVAVLNEWTQSYTRVMVSRYLANPFLCPEWRSIPLDTLKWGRGYAKDIAEQLAIIGQGIIIKGARDAEQADEKAAGATYYIRHRGSGYDCDVCDALCDRPISIDIPFEIPHPRCMCYPEYFYAPIEQA